MTSDDSGKVVYLAFRNEKIVDRAVGHGSCATCRNKTFLMIHDEHDYPALKCAACGDKIGRIGWVKD